MDMENAGLGAFHDEEWESSISNMFTFEAPDFGAQFLSHPTNINSSIVTPLFENEFFYNSLPSILHPNNSNSEFHSDNASDTTSYNYTSQATNSSENCHFSMANDVLSTTILNVEDSNSSQLGSEKGNKSLDNNNIGSPLHSEVQLKRKSNATEVEPDVKLKAELNKKARISNDNGKKSIESKKNTKQRESNVCEAEISDDDSMISEQTSALEISTSKGKKRASKGTATDPQSVYARRRREKINERLKILQNLVPNGTKVDISTMLEEAVQYVKFLQLQIRLLSSDDLWMYAPIAYNGVDMGLYKRISPFQLP